MEQEMKEEITQEEAEKLVESGEAEIPEDAIVDSEEVPKRRKTQLHCVLKVKDHGFILITADNEKHLNELLELTTKEVGEPEIVSIVRGYSVKIIKTTQVKIV